MIWVPCQGRLAMIALPGIISFDFIPFTFVLSLFKTRATPWAFGLSGFCDDITVILLPYREFIELR